MDKFSINHLRELESESIYIFREVAAQFERPALLFSGGKDSIIMFHLARKAFFPASVPFPLMHIDTGHNFDETIKFRDSLAKKYKVTMLVEYVQEAIDNGDVVEEEGIGASRNLLQTNTLLEGLEKHKIDAAMGGGRRDEEKARAKERFFSHRDDFGQWDPKNQRPELWNLYNGKKKPGEHFRVFPISNWTEMDVWQYILMEQIEIPNLYYTHKREVFKRDGVWMAKAPFMEMKDNEKVVVKDVRCRTIGDVTCTGVTESRADSLEEIVEEIATTRFTERGDRADDKRS
ncbi:MAG: sulfate adenylyltransferase subunit CysD, partial [Bacteroidota bacterium]|nr:sulfate adenylyltransferase subunit CysD [Bacteroidota bacterium]